ncbi:hypothetical protein EON64_08555 [archaeon]|nr:MAG: hypothetical protein EON64_08555 [archaeon]
MSTKKTRHERNALAQAEGLANVSESYMTAVIVLSSVDTSHLPEAAQAHVKEALNVFAFSLSDINDKYKKLSGRALDLSHIENAFQVEKTND